MRLVLLFYIIKYSKDHIKCLKIKSKRKKASAQLCSWMGCFGIFIPKFSRNFFFVLIIFKLRFFCAPARIICLLIFFFFVVWCFDEKNYKPEVVEQKTKPETEVSSSCSGPQQVFNNALFNFVGAISLDDFLNTGEGLFEAVERGRVDHLFLDASRIRTPCHQKKP